MKKILSVMMSGMLIAGSSYASAETNMRKDVYFPGYTENFIKVDRVKKPGEAETVEFKACEALDLSRATNQIQCKRIFIATVAEYQSMNSCLKFKNDNAVAGEMIGGLATFVGGLGGGIASASLIVGSGGTVLLVAGIVMGTVGATGLFMEADKERDNPELAKKRLVYNDLVIKDGAVDVVGVNYYEYISLIEKTIEDSWINCDLDPILTNEKASDNKINYVTLSSVEASAIKTALANNKK